MDKQRGILDENTARIEGIKALNEYSTCGQAVAPTTMSFADFLEHWIVNDCSATLNEITMINYRKKIKNLIVPYLGKYRMNTIDRDKLQNLLIQELPWGTFLTEGAPARPFFVL